MTVNLHIKDSYFALAINDLWPHVFVSFNVFLNHCFVINERQYLTKSFHFVKFKG